MCEVWSKRAVFSGTALVVFYFANLEGSVCYSV